MDTFNSNNPNQMPPMTSMSVKKSKAPIISAIVILIIIIIGGLYFLNSRSSQAPYVPATQGDSMTESLNQQGQSDDLNSIEADLNATNVSNLDQGAAVMEAELQ